MSSLNTPKRVQVLFALAFLERDRPCRPGSVLIGLCYILLIAIFVFPPISKADSFFIIGGGSCSKHASANVFGIPIAPPRVPKVSAIANSQGFVFDNTIEMRWKSPLIHSGGILLQSRIIGSEKVKRSRDRKNLPRIGIDKVLIQPQRIPCIQFGFSLFPRLTYKKFTSPAPYVSSSRPQIANPNRGFQMPKSSFDALKIQTVHRFYLKTRSLLLSHQIPLSFGEGHASISRVRGVRSGIGSTASLIALPDDRSKRSQNGPHRNPIGPCYEYVPPRHVFLGVLAFVLAMSAVFIPRRRDRGNTVLAIALIFATGFMPLVSHKHNCPRDHGNSQCQIEKSRQTLQHDGGNVPQKSDTRRGTQTAATMFRLGI